MPVRIERTDSVLTVILSRPAARNAVDPEHAQALHQAFVAFDTDEAAEIAVFWGEGGAFCAGADLKSLAARGIATEENRSTHASLEFPAEGGAVPRGPMGPTRLRLGKPVIAAIEGPAVAGGLELALWADCRVMPLGRAAFRRRHCAASALGRRGRALELIMTGRKVDAEECLRIGLCERLVPRGEARRAAEDMAREIARFPQASLRADRRSVYLQHGLSERAALEREWTNCAGTFKAEGAAGAARFASGAGRHGDFTNSMQPRN
jgi:enoyl-CoA hydratase/carnithine racemase